LHALVSIVNMITQSKGILVYYPFKINGF